MENWCHALSERNNMKSIVCVKPGEITLQDRDHPPSLEHDEVRVRIRRVGVCGTDYHIFEGSHPYLEYPRVIGHELAGEIADTGNVSDFQVGEKVIINPYLACGQCAACRKNKPNCCANIRVLGVHTDGGMCEYLNVPKSQLYSAKSLSFDQAAMTEFLAIGAHGVRRAEITAEDKVLIIGAGPIGLGAAIFSQIAGANVSVLDLSAERIERAQSLISGMTGFVFDENTDHILNEYTQGDGFNVVIDATGNKKAMENSLKYVTHGGSCVFISVVKDNITFSDPFFHSREMRLIGSRNATREDFEHVIESIHKGLIPTEKMLTHRASIEQAAIKIPQWITQMDTLVKAVIDI